jgi:SSS family solute:Na+ symporter
MFLVVKFHPEALSVIAMSTHAKAMAEDMYRALWSWIICVLVTVVVSLATKPKPESELTGLVYGVTAIPRDGNLGLFQRPIFWAGVAVALFLILQWIFW